MRVYEEFCTAVLSSVYTATKQEKAAIRRELTEHLEDHAAYLTEVRGLSGPDAAEAAVAAMGDPTEIGRELNARYSYVWQVLETLTRFLFAFFLIVAFIPILISGTAIKNSIDNIFEARNTRSYLPENTVVCDLRIPLKDQTLRLRGIHPLPEEDAVELCFTLYSTFPWFPVAGDTLVENLQFYSEDGTLLSSEVTLRTYNNNHLLHDGPTYTESFVLTLSGIGSTELLTMSYDRHGYAFSDTIPLTFSEDPADYPKIGTKGRFFP